MRRGALATGAIGLGAAGYGGVAADQQDADENQEDAAAQQLGNALVFSYEFFPGADFRVSAPLQTSTTVDILNAPDDQGIPEIGQPDEYSGYVVSYQLGQSAIYTFVFTRDATLGRDIRFRFGTDSQVFSNQLNLLQVPFRRIGRS